MSELGNSILLVVPARKGSSFTRKNLQPLNGKPLILYTLDATRIKKPHDTIVTTDDPYVEEVVFPYGVKMDQRPDNLADDYATLDNVMHYIAVTYPYSTYVCLPPTSPLRSAQHVEEALALFESYNCDSMIGVTEERKAIWKLDDDAKLKPLVERTVNRQLAIPSYISNGAIFISKREAILRSRKKASGVTMPYIMQPHHSVDIHTAEDLHLAEYLLGRS